jgi:hypothetical protein
VLYSFPMALGAPGVGTTALHEVQGLVDAGLDVDVVCTSTARDVPGARVTRTFQCSPGSGSRTAPSAALSGATTSTTG